MSHALGGLVVAGIHFHTFLSNLKKVWYKLHFLSMSDIRVRQLSLSREIDENGVILDVNHSNLRDYTSRSRSCQSHNLDQYSQESRATVTRRDFRMSVYL